MGGAALMNDGTGHGRHRKSSSLYKSETELKLMDDLTPKKLQLADIYCKYMEEKRENLDKS